MFKATKNFAYAGKLVDISYSVSNENQLEQLRQKKKKKIKQ
jgi:hypothetical protein